MLKDKIKICVVVSADIVVKFILFSQLRFLISEGYDVYVVCPDGKWIADIKKAEIKVKIIKIKRKVSPLYDLISLYRLWSYFRKEKFDIVHTNNPKPGLIGQLAAKMAGVPVIVNTIHGLYFQDDSSRLKRVFFTFIEKIAALCSDLIFSVNKEDIITLVREGISKLEKVKYLGNGIDIHKFNSGRFSEEFIDNKKRELNISSGFKVIGIVARLVKEKGYLDLFAAFKIILEKYPKTILLVVGPKEPEKEDTVDLEIVKDYGIKDNVIFLGERGDIDEIYPLMDIFILPSYREGLPVSLLEAMAEEKPVIATDIRGCREEVENSKEGFLVPVKNPEKLAEALLYFLENPEKAKEMGKNGRIKIIKEFDEKLVFERIKKEYSRLLRKKI